MPPENFRFGGGPDQTVLHPIVLIVMLLTLVFVLVLPRRHVIVPLIASTLLIPLGQELYVGGLHFFVYRIVILVLAVRIILLSFSLPDGMFGGRLDRFDFIFLAWALIRAFATMVLFRQGGMVITQAAFLLDVIGGFFILRYLIRDSDDAVRAIRTVAAVAVVVASLMAYERATGVNPFGYLGGVPLFSQVRNNIVRAQGPFQQELLAGAFGATLFPLMFALWSKRSSKVWPVAGALAAIVISYASASSTSVLAFFAGLAALLCWPLRRRMRLVRWGIVAMILALSAVMKAPVWFIINRIGIFDGSSSYHRAMLVNQFIFHFRDWFLIGTKDNPLWGDHMWDLCNEYIAQGQTGGLAAFVCFIALICVAFSRLGKARKLSESDRSQEWLFWALGCALFTHVVVFWGISYFDQTRFYWFLVLAIITAVTAPVLVGVKQTETPPAAHAKPVIKPWQRPLRPSPGALAKPVAHPSSQPAFRHQAQWRPRYQ